jgi:uncharacterized protein YgbK (DUF1537 family)
MASSRGPSLTVIADDLSGAADCAAVCVERGLSAMVALRPGVRPRDIDVWSVDGDTRAMTEESAAAVSETVAETASDDLLFKKLDSTLRGHVGAELAAALGARRRRRPDTMAILAPAYPALGRTTVGGRQRLHGRPLEEAEIWRREGDAGDASLVRMMRASGLSAALYPLDAVRGASAPAAMRELARAADVLVCDAETDEDLFSIARASLALDRGAIWAGSAGLAGSLVEALALARPAVRPAIPALRGSRLFVVGSRSGVAVRQAAAVAAEEGVVSIETDPTASQADLKACGAVEKVTSALDAGRDAIVWQHEIMDSPAGMGARRCSDLAAILAARCEQIGALVATGGDTARCLLDALGVEALELVAEIEAGAPLSLTVGGRRFPIITKAGAFGGDATLVNCLSYLRALPSTMASASGLSGRITA